MLNGRSLISTVCLIYLTTGPRHLAHIHVGNANNESQNTKQSFLLHMFCQSVCHANPLTFGSRQLSWRLKQWEFLVCLCNSSTSVLGFANSRCGLTMHEAHGIYAWSSTFSLKLHKQHLTFSMPLTGVGAYPQQDMQPMVPTWLYNDSLIPGIYFQHLVLQGGLCLRI